MRWIEKKMIDTFLMVSTSSITMQSLGKIEQRALAAGAKMVFVSFFTGRLPWQPPGIIFSLLSASVAKNQHFRPCRKNYALDRKMVDTF